ncbi:hypothetical protein J2Y45_002277 [Dyadobacter sp. BE34]|uniref:Uncharacterized protein n=1 Tax=Dyadobacter fermentans TaxID=94254 RepID=A0ABU1QW80_9BACT|nr:hypothetical protein [Dyadobacter fermentans]MDR7042826.1 hypothetical protein [Dyadobacter sp. BE242]MDR7197138.1 hypothetical protein [Dyadobacter sp. BE34]MDR7215427.1 hypothetical protein [Dyadobacter sp. BE31]MDR7262963.1 hypothetical protein [Dyadobacter sp. BE32]
MKKNINTIQSLTWLRETLFFNALFLLWVTGRVSDRDNA